MKSKHNIEPKIFVPSILITSLTIFVMLFYQTEAQSVISSIFTFMTHEIGWMYLAIILVFLCFSIWICCSKFGKIKLGEPDEKKEYSNWSWTAMMLTAGMSVAVVLLGFSEPIALLSSPPLGVEPMSNEAFQAAHMYEQFVEGFIAWSFYGPASVAVAYTIFIKKDSVLRLSNACKPVLGKYATKFPGHVIDVLVMLGMIGGISTSLGLGTPSITTFITYIFGIPSSLGLTLVIMLIWALIFGASVYMGLDAGIKRLSDLNLFILFGLAIMVAIAAPIMDIINMEFTSIGMLIDNFGDLTLGIGPFGTDTFTQDWTIFYWAWWISFMPMMALFGARISRGRTIRELVLGNMVFGGGGCMIIFGLFGGYSLYLQHSGTIDLVTILAESGSNNVIIAILETLPFANVVIFLVMILIFLFLATTIDSTAYTLASVCCVKLEADEQPVRWSRILWAGVLLLFSLCLVLIGGTSTVQTASIVLGFPLIFVSLIIMVSLRKMAKEHKYTK
ncbi:MAG: BCCT family transporter [Eubacteriales bacterium]